jgi:NAD(P)-dependent dehydrogenase (short-subunit alcohol dehydrogenase family)
VNAKELPLDPATPRLTGKTVVVTGAGSSGPGIGNGRATAIVMGRHGARVALLDRNRASATETQELMGADADAAVVVVCDVSRPRSCAEAVAAAARHLGGVDVLVNNVGVLGPPGTAVDVDPDEWDLGMRVNVTSMMLMAKHCIPHMLEAGGGSIVNVSSIAGLEGGHPDLLYPTSKGAIVQMTRAMAAHHGPSGIRVNCIAPGLVYTPMVAGALDEAAREARRLQSSLEVEGTAWDVAMTALFLASDESRWITGAVLPVDGGASAARMASVSAFASASAEHARRSPS